MKLRTRLAAGLSVSLLPLVAQAQSAIIVTSPATQPAPALSGIMLMVLMVALSAGAMVLLRRTRLGGAAQAAVVLITATLAGIGYATVGIQIVVSGEECGQRTEHEYNPENLAFGSSLTNECSGSVRIISIDFDCDNGNEVQGGGGSESRMVCEEGLVLAPGEACALPSGCNT